MRNYLFITFILFSISLSAAPITKEEAVDYLVKSFPQAQLVDIYKSFYQDNFGPGHLLGDTLAAKRYFLSELADTTDWGGPEFEFTGEGKNFVRLNMDLIRKGIVPADEYFEAFQKSLGRVEKPSDEFWISEWAQIDSIIRQKDYHFIDEGSDREYINEKIASRNFPIHHSDNFNKNYNFHYRIISLPEFEKLKTKYLKRQDNISLTHPVKPIYDFHIPSQSGDSVAMDQFNGKLLLFVDTANVDMVRIDPNNHHLVKRIHEKEGMHFSGLSGKMGSCVSRI